MSTNSKESPPILRLFFFEDELIRTRYGKTEAHVGGRSDRCFEFLPGVRALVCLVLYSAARAVSEESEPQGSTAMNASVREGHSFLFGGPDSLVGTFRNLRGKEAPAWLGTIFGRTLRIEDLVKVAKARDRKTAGQSRPVSLTGEIVHSHCVQVFSLPERESSPTDAARISQPSEINRLAMALEAEYEGWTQKLIGEWESGPVRLSDYSTVNLELDLYYDKLATVISSLGPSKHAVLIQHGNSSSAALVSRLLRDDAIVELFIQDPQWGTPPRGSLLATQGVEQFRRRYWDDGGELLVRYYRTPASLRVVWVTGRVLAVGWYTYHQEDVSLTRESGYKLLGHNRPNLVAIHDTEPYRILVEMVDSVLVSMRAFAGEPVLHLERGRLPASTRVGKPHNEKPPNDAKY